MSTTEQDIASMMPGYAAPLTNATGSGMQPVSPPQELPTDVNTGALPAVTGAASTMIPPTQQQPQYTPPDTSAQDTAIANYRAQATAAEGQLEGQERGAADLSAGMAGKLGQEQQQLDQLFQKYPTSQVAYGTAMSVAPVIGILTALGGKASGISGQAMLGALTGMVTGLNEGAQDKYKESLEKWKEEMQKLKDQHAEQLEIYKVMLDAYSGRADAAQKARDFALSMTHDAMDEKKALQTQSLEIFKLKEQQITQLERATMSFQVAEQRLQLEKEKQEKQAASAQAIDLAATEYLNTGHMPSMGFGGTEVRMQVLDRAAQKAQEMGGPQAVAVNQAIYKSTAAELQKVQGQEGNVMAYEANATKQMDMVLALNNQVPRSQVPAINKAILAGQTEIEGDPQATKLMNAVLTASTEYAKVMSGGTGSAAASSDASRKEAQRLMEASMNPQQLAAVIQQEKQSMRNRIQGFAETRQQLQQRLQGLGTGMQGGQQQQPVQRQTLNGKTYVKQNGQWYEDTGNAAPTGQ